MKRCAFVCSVLAGLLVVGVSWAATDTDTLTVTATVMDTARIVSVGDISFGNYDPTDPAAADADGAVRVQATKGLSYTIYIASDRSMTDGTDTLVYELYSDGGRASAWGSDMAGGESYTSTGNGTSEKSIYGRVAALQDVQAGGYSDTVTITLEW